MLVKESVLYVPKWILVLRAVEESKTCTEITKVAESQYGYTHQILKLLKEERYIVNSPEPGGDPRSKAYILTDKGKAAVKASLELIP